MIANPTGSGPVKRLPRVNRLLAVIAEPRPTAIHVAPCKHCPSAHAEATGDHDPESLDYKAAPRALQLESVFPCGWRPQKACKGYCDFLGVAEADLIAARTSTPPRKQT